MTSEIRPATRPVLTTIGEKTLSTTGWRIPLVEDHLDWHLREGKEKPHKKWCKVECMARTMFLKNTVNTREEVRHRVPRAFKELLAVGRFLVIEKGPRNMTIALKLFETDGESERQFAERQINRMKAHKEVSEKIWEQALEVISSQK